MQSGTDRINKKRTLERGERGLRLQSPRLIVSGVTGKREKRGKRREREKKATTEGKRKTIKRRIFYNWQPFLLLLAFVSWHGSIFSKKAHNTLKKNMFVPRMTSIHQQRPPPRKYTPPPPIFHANQPTSRGIAGTEQANGSLCGERLSLMMELKDVMDGWNSWFFSEKNGENCNMDI